MLLHQVVLLPGLGHLLGASIEALRQLQVFDALQLEPLPPLQPWSGVELHLGCKSVGEATNCPLVWSSQQSCQSGPPVAGRVIQFCSGHLAFVMSINFSQGQPVSTSVRPIKIRYSVSVRSTKVSQDNH